MRRSPLRLYTPFIALAVLQAALVVAMPSDDDAPQDAFAQSGGFESPEGGGATEDFGSGDVAGAVDPAAAGGETGAAAGGASGGGSAGTAGGTAGGGGGAAGSGGGGAGAPEASGGGDTSHCKNGRQTDVIYNAPPCVPKFTGSNGGATYQGVSEEEIKFVRFRCKPNEQVDAILASQGLATTDEEAQAMMDAAFDFFNSTYELYGRKLVWDDYIGDCPSSPVDPAKSRQAAAEVIRTKPFAVYVASGGPEAADAFARAGIVTLGQAWLGQEFYAGRRPFRWDIFPSLTESSDWVAEYYCKKMAKKPASHAGQLIHPTIGGRDATRKMAVIVPDNGNGASVPGARHLSNLVKQCAGADTPVFTYASDINRAEEQSRVIVAGLIDTGATTVVCMCDPVFPVFFTQQMTRNNYFPEHLMAGSGLLDYDVLGRLYDQAQWQHAFGLSHLVEPVPFEQTEAARIWRASGREGQPCSACNLITGYMMNLGAMVQMAGPNLNPGTVERALVGQRYSRGGWAETKGDSGVYLIRWGPGDYNAISDYREVYWDPAARSTIDGKNGAYVGLNGGKRYAGGEQTADFTVPQRPQ